MPKLAFVCVGNAGRSQMATAFAEAQRDDRGRDDIDIVTGGTNPKPEVHDEVIEAMADVGASVDDRTPRQITPADVADADIVVTMGCDAEGFTPPDWNGSLEEWSLTDPDGQPLEAVRAQRDEIRRRVEELFDRL